MGMEISRRVLKSEVTQTAANDGIWENGIMLMGGGYGGGA